MFAFSGLYEKAKLLFSLRPWHPIGEIVLTRLRWSAAELLPVPPPVRKAPHIKFFQLEKILFIDLLPTDFDLIQVLV